jgi:hypothetical protein
VQPLYAPRLSGEPEMVSIPPVDRGIQGAPVANGSPCPVACR